MLQPENRLLLVDALRPPVGYQLDAAMAVTFTLDLRALLTVPAAFALANVESSYKAINIHGPDPDDTTGESNQNLAPIDLIHALRTYANQITIFGQAGEIALPPSQRVFAFLEGSVVPVTAPRGGIVHPKVWVLRFKPIDEASNVAGPSRLRVLCASRNLTFDLSWDTLLRLDQSVDSTGWRVEPIADLFEGLIGNTVQRPDDRHTDRVTSLCTDLRTATFALPEGIDDLAVHVLGLGDTQVPFPQQSDRSLVISPFLSNDFFTSVAPNDIDEVVSRPEALACLNDDALSHIGTPYIFDDGSNPDFESENNARSEQDPGQPLQGLHAKLFAFEHGRRAQVFCGSANATGAAFRNNVEVLFELRGPVSALGIDALTNGTDDAPGLRSRFQTYSSAADIPESDETGLDAARRQMAKMAITGTVHAEREALSITYESKQPIDAPEGVTVSCWPLSVQSHQRGIAVGQPLNERFDTTVESLSGFLAFKLTHLDSGETTGFVVPVALSGVPEDRDSRILAWAIGDAKRFFAYVLAVLNEREPDAMDAIAINPRVTDGGSTPGYRTQAILEELLRALRQDPQSILGLHPLVLDLAKDLEANVLPDEFMDLWMTIYNIALEDAQ